MNISYFVRKNNSKSFAVLRNGPKGGIRHIATYSLEHQAEEVCKCLNRWATQER